MTRAFTKSVFEEAALAWLQSAGRQVARGPDLSPGGDTLTLALSQWERESYSEEDATTWTAFQQIQGSKAEVEVQDVWL